jgi:long-subunit fatty acid transport protein
LQTTSVSVDRSSIDSQTGSNPGNTTFPSANGSATRQPFRWPLGPGSFLAVGAGIGRRFGIAVALYSPFSTKLDMSSNPDAPARYHLVSMELNHIALTPGIAIHASDSIQLGVATGFLFPTAHLVFDEDTAMGSATSAKEDQHAAARYDLGTNGLIAPSLFLSVGADYRRGRFALGIAYTSAPLGTGGVMYVPLDNVNIGLPSNLAPQTSCPAANSNCLVGQMSYHLPSIYSLGTSWQASRHWSVSGMVRWLRYGSHDKVTLLFSGPSSQQTLGTTLSDGSTVPDHVVLYRGFVDSLDVRGRVAYESKEFRVGGTLRLETSAVPASHVNAAAIDGTKLEPSLAAEMRIWRQIRLGASYAFMWMLPVDTGKSVFDPTAASACSAAGGDLSTPACQARMNGQARPSAAGTYHLWRQTLSVYTTIGL